ncbi:MAG: hypothetical protein DCC71_09075 [Proteobacteria bacterium]|nr:MAG: hypothetical protein DCC71_09075 [Pseudomonadota bacterium]
MLILVEILAVALVALAVSRLAPEPWRGRLLNVLKAWVTVRAFWLLLDHQVKMEPDQIEALHLTGKVPEGTTHIAAWRLIWAQIGLIEARTFWTFVLLSAAVKFVGILSSMYRWQVLLRGQRIELPFRHIFGSFLIGRFIGTFLPSTAGLDGYKLYDAARFSGKTVEVTATTALEKVLGVFGIFLSFLVALPFGIKIFGENGPMVAAITVPLSLGLIGALLVVLWFPGLVQWLLTHLPIPGRARLEGVVLRISNAAAAYRDKKTLVLLALGLSFVVHFTTAAMYYFTALAIGAQNAEFWPIAFGSSIQIFATVVSPFTIAGAGIREAAQYVLLSNQIGAAAAIVSAALGFWAAEALTLLGGVFWWIRPSHYRPAWCRVNGRQVDYDEAARAAVALETEDDRRRHAARPAADVPSFATRVRIAASAGFGAGALAGLLIGVVEAFVIAQEGLGSDSQVLWYGPLVYAALLGLAGLAGGVALSVLPMERREIRGWVASLAWIALGVGPALLIALFRIRRDVFHEQMPPLPVLAAVLGVAGLLVLFFFLLGPRVFSGRVGRVAGALPALVAMALVAGGGALVGRALYPSAPPPPAPPVAPAALADKPNLLLIVIDTLRADVLSCYGGPIEAKAICGVAEDGGTVFTGFSHASWTKPSFASLLTSTLPSTHNTMAKTATLPQDLELVSEALQKHGYATGGIVANINLAPSFGFEQGYDEYHYLSPDYLFGAEESSSKLIFYQIGRKVALKVKPGHRVSDYYQNAETVTGVASDWLTRHKDSRFFLLLHYMDPHDPYFAHPYRGEAIARVEAENPDPALAGRMRELYDEEVRYTDEWIAELEAHLRSLGLWDDTMIVITADHGEEFFEHGGWWHGKTLYEEQIAVPMLVKWPKGRVEAPARVDDHPVRHKDVAPTLLALAGAPVPPGMQGKDLAVPYEQRSETERLHYAEEDHEGNVLRAIRTKDWKLIEANAGNPRGLPETELFEILADPHEKQNVAHARPEKTAELRIHAEAQRQVAASQAVEGGAQAKLSKEECEKLRVLGYVQDCGG